MPERPSHSISVSLLEFIASLVSTFIWLANTNVIAVSAMIAIRTMNIAMPSGLWRSVIFMVQSTLNLCAAAEAAASRLAVGKAGVRVGIAVRIAGIGVERSWPGTG